MEKMLVVHTDHRAAGRFGNNDRLDLVDKTLEIADVLFGVVRHRVEVSGEIGRITSYNVCYTKLLRG